MAAKNDSGTLPPATNDAYTGMLAISLCALIVGCVLLYLDYSHYPDSKAPAVPKAPPIATPAPQQQGAEPQVAPKQDEAPKDEAPPDKK
jgi:hypothetical protein